MHYFISFWILAVACASIATAIPTFSFAAIQNAPDSEPPSLGAPPPTSGIGSERSRTATIGTELDEFNATLVELEPQIEGLPNCACAVDTNAELDAVTQEVADIEGKCSALDATISEIENELPSLSEGLASALTYDEVQQMNDDIATIQNMLNDFLLTLSSESHSDATATAVTEQIGKTSALYENLQQRDEKIATCAATCNSVSSSDDIEGLRAEIDELKTLNAPVLLSGLHSTIQENQVLVDSLLTSETDKSAEESLNSVADKLNEVSTMITGATDSLDTFATNGAVQTLRDSFTSISIAEEVEVAYQSYQDFKTEAEKLGETIISQAAAHRTTDKLTDALTDLSDKFTGLTNQLAELQDITSSTQVDWLDAEIASAKQAGQGVLDIIQSFTDTTAASGTSLDPAVQEASVEEKEKRWHLIKEGYKPTTCPDHFEFEESLNMCFYLGLMGNAYNQAAGICKAIGGASGILVVLTEERRQFLYNLMVERGINYYYWIGLAQHDGQLRWADGSSFDWSLMSSFAWYTGMAQSCVEMGYDGLMYEGYCTFSDYCICEIPLA